jgi:hypothetical protein
MANSSLFFGRRSNHGPCSLKSAPCSGDQGFAAKLLDLAAFSRRDRAQPTPKRRFHPVFPLLNREIHQRPVRTRLRRQPRMHDVAAECPMPGNSVPTVGSVIAAAWVGALGADLVVNQPLKLTRATAILRGSRGRQSFREER